MGKIVPTKNYKEMTEFVECKQVWKCITYSHVHMEASAFEFIPTESEKSVKKFHLQYNATTDTYCRVHNGKEEIRGWRKCVWNQENVFRNEEDEWQTVYLSRKECNPSGKVSWKLNCAPVGMKIKAVSVRTFSQTFHSGSVLLRVRSGETRVMFPGDGELRPLKHLSGFSELVLEAELSGGDGMLAWQHAQIFRQTLKETEKISLDLIVEIEDA
ncbi:peptide-N(4)-(N-acetyl-beta-glucosaminyl)asparagine amidase-like isoform X2 [Hoplias malabaricus]|uniref:peptide-N(4)-(N-acetyl-beta- glucosaminyl)asparagine amidase-like isoform X2 n=1 Tax=Hoplias malabaricus TaxID=27720 RepID=UPI0034621359